MKTCTCCSESKPLDMFHKRAKSLDGLALICKTCDKAYKLANKEKIAAARKEYRKANKEKIAQNLKEYRQANKDRLAQQDKEYRQANKEKIAERTKKYRQENADKVKEVQKNYLEKNAEKVLARQKTYRENNKPLRTALERKRQAAKIHRTPAWLTDSDKLRMACLYQLSAMRTRESGQEWHVDHIIPLQGRLVSGLHVPSNLRVVTAVENRQKYNNFIEG